MMRSKRFLSCAEVMIALTTSIAAVVATPGACQAALSDCIDATCRITTTSGSRGSGCVFEIDDGKVWIVTAGHVVGDAGTVQCEFWRTATNRGR